MRSCAPHSVILKLSNAGPGKDLDGWAPAMILNSAGGEIDLFLIGFVCCHCCLLIHENDNISKNI